MLTRHKKHMNPAVASPSATEENSESWDDPLRVRPCNDMVLTMRDEGESMLSDGPGKRWKVKGRIDSFGGRVTLLENVVIRERSGLHFFVYKILGTVPAHPDQRPHKTTIKGKPLYVHATIRRTSHFSNDFIIKRLDTDTAYEVHGGSKLGPTHLKVFDSISKEYYGSVRQFFKNNNVCESKWTIKVKEGIAPNIMICLTAIANKSMGRDPAKLLDV